MICPVSKSNAEIKSKSTYLFDFGSSPTLLKFWGYVKPNCAVAVVLTIRWWNIFPRFEALREQILILHTLLKKDFTGDFSWIYKDLIMPPFYQTFFFHALVYAKIPVFLEFQLSIETEWNSFFFENVHRNERNTFQGYIENYNILSLKCFKIQKKIEGIVETKYSISYSENDRH